MTDPLDDHVVDLLLRGEAAPAGRPDLQPLARALRELEHDLRPPEVTPSPRLAALLGDVPPAAVGARRVLRPAIGIGSAGLALKLWLGGAAAATTLVVLGGASGVLPDPVQDVVDRVVDRPDLPSPQPPGPPGSHLEPHRQPHRSGPSATPRDPSATGREGRARHPGRRTPTGPSDLRRPRSRPVEPRVEDADDGRPEVAGGHDDAPARPGPAGGGDRSPGVTTDRDEAGADGHEADGADSSAGDDTDRSTDPADDPDAGADDESDDDSPDR